MTSSIATAAPAAPVAPLVPSTVTRIRARYAETDQMGVVHHANYLIWMEVARVEFCRDAGLRYRDLEDEHNVLMVVTDVGCRYLSPARYDDEIEITTTLKRANHRIVTFEYEMRAVPDQVETDRGRRIAIGHTGHIFLTRDLRPTTLPMQFRPMFGIARREPAQRSLS
jgi:acyl-CoA thioester hydrolase